MFSRFVHRPSEAIVPRSVTLPSSKPKAVFHLPSCRTHLPSRRRSSIFHLVVHIFQAEGDLPSSILSFIVHRPSAAVVRAEGVRPSVRSSSLFPAEGGLPSSILSYTSSQPKAISHLPSCRSHRPSSKRSGRPSRRRSSFVLFLVPRSVFHLSLPMPDPRFIDTETR
jgi:hypothetical protein